MYAESPFAGWGMGASDWAFRKKSLVLDPVVGVRVFREIHSGRTLLLLWSPLSKVSPATSTGKSSMCSWSLILNYFSFGFIDVLRKISQSGNSCDWFGHLQDEVLFKFSESECRCVKNKALKVQKWHFPLQSGMLKPGTILAKQTLWPHFTLRLALSFMLKYRFFFPPSLKN